VTGLLRIRNEARWIERCISSILPVCDQVLVMDDHSTDGTPDLCTPLPGVTVYQSPFANLDEARDKNWLLQKAAGAEWVLMIDGDELLEPGAIETVSAVSRHRAALVYSFRVLYLWDSETQVRTDGVYGRFRRPSMFRPDGATFQATHAGGNFHCGNVPRDLQPYARPIDAALLHFGYLHREDRLRKYAWYNLRDPHNRNEDGYRHIVQGDLPEVPGQAKLLHAGPLTLEDLCSR